MAKVPNPALRKAFMDIVRNQLRNGNPPETRATLDRLIASGHSQERSRELIAAVLSSEIFDILKEGQPYNEARYVAALQKLPQLPWDEA